MISFQRPWYNQNHIIILRTKHEKNLHRCEEGRALSPICKGKTYLVKEEVAGFYQDYIKKQWNLILALKHLINKQGHTWPEKHSSWWIGF